MVYYRRVQQAAILNALFIARKLKPEITHYFDIGCGPGDLSKQIIDETGWKAHLVDEVEEYMMAALKLLRGRDVDAYRGRVPHTLFNEYVTSRLLKSPKYAVLMANVTGHFTFDQLKQLQRTFIDRLNQPEVIIANYLCWHDRQKSSMLNTVNRKTRELVWNLGLFELKLKSLTEAEFRKVSHIPGYETFVFPYHDFKTERLVINLRK